MTSGDICEQKFCTKDAVGTNRYGRTYCQQHENLFVTELCEAENEKAFIDWVKYYDKGALFVAEAMGKLDWRTR